AWDSRPLPGCCHLALLWLFSPRRAAEGRPNPRAGDLALELPPSKPASFARSGYSFRFSAGKSPGSFLRWRGRCCYLAEPGCVPNSHSKSRQQRIPEKAPCGTDPEALAPFLAAAAVLVALVAKWEVYGDG